MAERRKKRWWWRVLAGVAVALAVPLVMQWYQGNAAQKRLDDTLAALKAKGEPTTPADFNVPAPPDDQNAAVLLRKAAAALQRTNAWNEWERQPSVIDGFPLTSDERRFLGAVMQENGEALALLRQATRRTRIHWGYTYKTPMLGMLVPHTDEVAELARLSAVRATFAHDRGDDRQALASIDDALFLQWAAEEQPSLLSYLVSLGCGHHACEQVIVIAPDLRLAGGPADTTPEQCRSLITRLLNERGVLNGYRQALRGDRAAGTDILYSAARGQIAIDRTGGGAPTLTEKLKLFGIRALVFDNATVMARHLTQIFDNMEQPNLPAYRAVVPAFPPEFVSDPRRYKLAETLLPSWGRVSDSHYRQLADRRLAATALALRLYAVDHNGRLPESLKELVPAYLPAVPLDPLAEGVQPLRYRSTPKPIVYSVGLDARDDGGDEARANGSPADDRWGGRDAVVHLTRQPRRPQPPRLPEEP